MPEASGGDRPPAGGGQVGREPGTRRADRVPFERVAGVGLGLIGGSIALAVRRAWPSVVVTGVDSGEVIDRARSLGAVDAASTDLVIVSEASLVVLAAPVRQNIGRLLELPRLVRPSAVVTDVGSTKRAIVEAARHVGGEVTFVGGHPLAGATASGIEHASADLFSGRRWLFTPEADSPPDALERLRVFVSMMGAEPCWMDAAEHDHLMAYLSHLPQLAASALMQVAGDEVGAAGLEFAGPGLTDTTRLAGSPSGIWADICLTNADYLQAALGRLADVLDSLRARVGDRDALEGILGPARAWREQLIASARRLDRAPEGGKR